MAQAAPRQWGQPAAGATVQAEPGIVARVAGRWLDWEDWLTLGLALGAMLGVSLSLESPGWTREMPAITLVGLLALLFALFLARSPLKLPAAWPLALLMGAAVTSWQTLDMIGYGSVEERLDAMYFRFQTWFHIAVEGGISNDPLPFNVLVVGLTWLGVFLYGWSLYRWNNAWLGLIPGGIALFLNLTFISDEMPLGMILYVMFGFLLLMRTNLTAGIKRWREAGIEYPPLISLSFLHYTTWAGLFLVVAAWIAPVGPFPSPGVVDYAVERLQGLGVHFVRLAGPLHVNKVIPVHDYTGVLPFQGSIKLGARELLAVKVNDPTITGPIALRGAAYDEYGSGGWTAGPRRDVALPASVAREVREEIETGEVKGRLISLDIQVTAKSVVGSVLFAPGDAVSAGVPVRIDAQAGSVGPLPLYLPNGGLDLTDEEVLAGWTPQGVIGLSVNRDRTGRVLSMEAIAAENGRVPDALVVRPDQRLAKGESYRVVGLVRDVDADELRQSADSYPAWMAGYQSLPSSLPGRVWQLAWDVAGQEPTTYDRAKAIETYLRDFPVEYRIDDTPPGRDTVDYFLFELKEGYFDYHASAMVVMLRALGIPSRLAVGFVVDEADRDKDSGAFVARDRNAYAWAEAYFPGQGWVQFNPSPDREAELRPGVEAPTDTGREVDPRIFDDLPVSSGGQFPIGGGDVARSSGSRPASGGVQVGYVWVIALGVAGALAVAGAAGALGWRQSVTGLPYAQQVWEKTVRLASWAGEAPRPGQTPGEFARQLERRLSSAPGISLLADAYNRSRFGRREPDEGEAERLRRLWPQLRWVLLGAIVSRVWRRRSG